MCSCSPWLMGGSHTQQFLLYISRKGLNGPTGLRASNAYKANSACVLFSLKSGHCPLTNGRVSGYRPPQASTVRLLMEKAGLESKPATTLGQWEVPKSGQMGAVLNTNHIELGPGETLKAKQNKTKPSSVLWEALERGAWAQVCHFRWLGCGKNGSKVYFP